MISAPMLGHNQRIISLHMGLRASHMRNQEDDMYTISNKIITMVNPTFEPEAHSDSSWQYEYNMLDGQNCNEARLVYRHNFINVKFYQIQFESPNP